MRMERAGQLIFIAKEPASQQGRNRTKESPDRRYRHS